MTNAEKFLNIIIGTTPIAIRHMTLISSDPEVDDYDLHTVAHGYYFKNEINITKEEFDELSALIKEFRQEKKTHETKM